MKLSTNLDANNAARILNLPLPNSAGEPATKAYADALKANEDWKDSVRLGAPGNISISVAPANIDGVAAAAGNRILLPNQTNASENGIYVYNGSGSPLTRAQDADANSEVTSGLTVNVTEGNTLVGTKWQLITPDPIVLGTTNLSFAQTGNPISAGNGLVKSGNVISLDAPVSTANGGTGSNTPAGARATLGAITKFAATFGDGAATSFNIDHNLNTTDVTVGVYLLASGAEEIVDIARTTSNRVVISGFPTAPAANTYRVVVTG